jgi:hypothetical protein
MIPRTSVKQRKRQIRESEFGIRLRRRLAILRECSGLNRINKEEGGKLCSQLLGTRERFHKPVYDEAVIEFTWIFNEAMLAKKSTTPSRFSIFKARKSIPFALSSEL